MGVLGDINSTTLRDSLSRGDLRLKVGPYVYELQSKLSLVQEGLECLYSDFQVNTESGFSDYHIALRPSNLRQRMRGKLEFHFDNQKPFGDIAKTHAYAFLEWGMNWCVSVNTNEYLVLHAAVVAKDNVALVMPGLPGAGKSTLCAALALNGWRVLSDEHAMIQLGGSELIPLCRPVSLKNESIDVIRTFDKAAVIGPETLDTHKGRVAHMKADMAKNSHNVTPVPARLMIFPQFAMGEGMNLTTKTKTESFMFAAHHSFNYSLLMDKGFETMVELMDAVDCYDLHYGDLEQALQTIEKLFTDIANK